MWNYVLMTSFYTLIHFNIFFLFILYNLVGHVVKTYQALLIPSLLSFVPSFPSFVPFLPSFVSSLPSFVPSLPSFVPSLLSFVAKQERQQVIAAVIFLIKMPSLSHPTPQAIIWALHGTAVLYVRICNQARTFPSPSWCSAPHVPVTTRSRESPVGAYL